MYTLPENKNANSQNNMITVKLNFVKAFREKAEKKGVFQMDDKPLLFKPNYPPQKEGNAQNKGNLWLGQLFV